MRISIPLLLCAAATPAALAMAAGIATVSQQGRAFSTREVQIAPGDMVHFNNEDEFLHQIYVHSPSFSYESAEQAPGEVVTVRFPTAGTFEVRCHIHPKMLLTVNVR